MLWTFEIAYIQKVLAHFEKTCELSEESQLYLKDLTQWLTDSRQRAHQERSSCDRFTTVICDCEFDTNAVIQKVNDDLHVLQERTITLVDKLAAFNATLTDEQKAEFNQAFEHHGNKHHGNKHRGWHRADRPHNQTHHRHRRRHRHHTSYQRCS